MSGDKGRMKSVLGLAVSVSCACMGAFAAVELGENIVANGKFENEQSDVPGFWHMDSWNHPENLTVDPTGGPDGLPAIGARPPADGKPTSFGISQGGFDLDLKGRYRLSGWVRKRDFRTGKRCGLVLAPYGWSSDCGVDFGGGTCDWTRFEREVHAIKSKDGLMRLCFFVQEYTGSIEIADVRLEAMDEETCRKTGRSALVAAQRVPKLVPWEPLLSEIPRNAPAVTFRFFGELADPAAHEAMLSVGGKTSARAPLPERGGKLTLALPLEVKNGRLTVEIVNRVTGEKAFSRTHDFRTVEACGDFPSGRRLNNMVVELFRGKVEDGQSFAFGLAHGGWTFIAAKGAEEVLLDGRRVIAPDTPRGETFRELEAGRHTVTVKGSAELTVRRIPELFCFAPVLSPVKENPPFDWAFQEKYVLPAVTTLNGGTIPIEARRRYRDSGRLWLANLISRNLADDGDLTRRLEKANGMSAAAIFQDGVTCDEQGFTDVPTMARYAAGLWAYGDRNGKRAYTWAIGHPATEGVDHDLISAAANGTGGRGKFLSEIYLKAQPTEAKARAAMELAAGEKIGHYRRFTPLVNQKYGIVFGNFNQAPGISLCGYPEVDYRYYLDMQFNMLANDPRFVDLPCTGVWGSYRADDELHRWTFMLMRHYFVEGRREMLSGKYGFRYIPGHLRNPDFADGLVSWRASQGVSVGCCKDFGTKTEGRWLLGMSVGDTFAVLPRTAEGTASVSQPATGLVPGRKYVLRFADFDVDDVMTARFAPRRIGVEVELDGAEIDRTLTWEHVDERPEKDMKGARINYRQIVFRAKSAEVGVTFSNVSAKSGERVGVNYISLLPYLPRLGD